MKKKQEKDEERKKIVAQGKEQETQKEQKVL